MEYKLEDICEFIRNGANIKQNDNIIGYPITRIETIASSYIDLNRVGYAGIIELGKYEEYLLNDGDILMSHINSEKHLGKTALYEKCNEKIIHGMNLLCLRPKKNIVEPRYLNYYFNNLIFKRQLPKIIKKSVNQASFSVTDLKNIKVILPNKDMQLKVIKKLDKAQDLIDKRKEQIKELDELVKSQFIEMFGDPIKNTM
ncbi:restriction endonuclease subunit S, partial [uncultured Clostridium sp.]|uniref:restriction endonuclease subunit S n=1 Tax=uncultured Clostridium sp. TaxID=59620 RepID=UPI0026169631